MSFDGPVIGSSRRISPCPLLDGTECLHSVSSLYTIQTRSSPLIQMVLVPGLVSTWTLLPKNLVHVAGTDEAPVFPPAPSVSTIQWPLGSQGNRWHLFSFIFVD